MVPVQRHDGFLHKPLPFPKTVTSGLLAGGRISVVSRRRLTIPPRRPRGVSDFEQLPEPPRRPTGGTGLANWWAWYLPSSGDTERRRSRAAAVAPRDVRWLRAR